MVKQWLGVCIATSLLTACTVNESRQQPTNQAAPLLVCNGPIVEISGQEPRFETLNMSLNQDYRHDGKQYRIIKNPANYSETGFAAIYDAPTDGSLTASGEPFDPLALTIAHPTLPIPSYARITNMANGRMLVVRVNDRGPYGTRDRIVSLSRSVADRLNTSNNSKVRIDPILVAPDGSYSGPGMACSTIAKQTYALPPRPNLDRGSSEISSLPTTIVQQDNIRAISNSTLQSNDSLGTPIKSGSFLGAPSPLPSGILEKSEVPAAVITAQPEPALNHTPPINLDGQYMVQVGAVSDNTRAQQLLNKLSQQFATQGAVSYNGAVYRIQLGPFNQRSEANALQQRLLSEAQQQSFITNAPAH